MSGGAIVAISIAGVVAFFFVAALFLSAAGNDHSASSPSGSTDGSGDVGGAPGDGVKRAPAQGIQSLSVSALGENRDADRFAEVLLVVQAESSSGSGNVRFNGNLRVLVYEQQRETDCSPPGERQVVERSMEVTSNQFTGEIFPRLETTFDDYWFQSGGTYRILATLRQGDASWEAGDRYYHLDDQDNQTGGIRDDSSNISGIRVGASAVNVDADPAPEARVSLTGTHGGSFDTCRFTGSVTLRVEHREYQYPDYVYTFVAEFEINVSHVEFDSSYYYYMIEDSYFEESEWYRITAGAEIPARGEVYEDNALHWHHQF